MSSGSPEVAPSMLSRFPLGITIWSDTIGRRSFISCIGNVAHKWGREKPSGKSCIFNIWTKKNMKPEPNPSSSLVFLPSNSENLEALVVKLVKSGQIFPKKHVYIYNCFCTYVWVPVGVLLRENIDIDLIWNEKTSSTLYFLSKKALMYWIDNCRSPATRIYDVVGTSNWFKNIQLQALSRREEWFEDKHVQTVQYCKMKEPKHSEGIWVQTNWCWRDCP